MKFKEDEHKMHTLISTERKTATQVRRKEGGAGKIKINQLRDRKLWSKGSAVSLLSGDGDLGGN